MSWSQSFGIVLIYLGAVLCLISSIGLLRLPGVYARFHAATKALTGGVLFLAAGSAIYIGAREYAAKLGLIALLFLVSNPVGTHAIARAVHRQESRSPEESALVGEGEGLRG